MMTLSKIEMSNNAMGGIGELLPKAKGLLQDMGMEPADVIQRILAPPDEGSGTVELITSALGVAGEVAKGWASRSTPMPVAPVGRPRMLPPQAPPQQAAPPQQSAPKPPLVTPAPEAAPPQDSPATGAGLPLQDQKSARNTLRKLVKILGGKERGEWDEIIMTTLASQPAIYPYVKAVTVRSALYEAGGSDYMVGEIIKGLKDSPLVPADIPYGA